MLQYYKLHPDAIPPTKAYEQAVGYDLHALVLTAEGNESISHIVPHSSKMIPTGLILVAPKRHYLTVCSRSGLAAHDPPIFVANAPGIIDPDYTGEIKVILFNGGIHTYTVRHGERIAQVCILPLVPNYALEELHEHPEVEENARGPKGFGSTWL
jgi:dUTP pyrophosphatase